MRVVKQIIAQPADSLKEPKKKRRCEAECKEHQFIIRQISKGSKNMDISMNFCPKYRRGDLPPENSFPEFNRDQFFYTSAFILGVDKKLSQKIQKQEQIEHIRIVRLTCEKNCLVRFPKPNSKHSLCSVCKVTYVHYLKHILSQFHKEKINNCPYNHHIAELSQEFQHLHPQDLINVSSPFQIAIKGQSQPIISKKQVNLKQQYQTPKIIEYKQSQKHYYGNQQTKLFFKVNKNEQNKNCKIMDIKQKNVSSLIRNESSSSLSSDQSSSSSSDSSSSSSISSDSNSKSSYSSDTYRRKNKSSHSSSTSSISSSSLSSSQSISSLSPNNNLVLDTNNCQLHPKKQKRQLLDSAMQKKKKKKQYKKNSLKKNASINRQKLDHFIKNNQQKLSQIKKEKKCLQQKQLKAFDPLVKVCKKRKKDATDTKIINQQQDKKSISEQQINKNMVRENVGNQSWSALKIENQQSLIKQRHLYDIEQVLKIPIQIGLPTQKSLNESKSNRQNANQICRPKHIQAQLITSASNNLFLNISQKNIRQLEKVNISQKQSSIQNTIPINEFQKIKLKTKITPFRKCHLYSQKEKKHKGPDQNIALPLLQFENQKNNWLQDWKRASSLNFEAPLSKKFMNNKREMFQHQLLIEVDDDVQDTQINDEKQTNHQNQTIDKVQNSQHGNKRLSLGDISKINHNGRLSLQKLSDFLIGQYAKLKKQSKSSESLPEDVQTYLSNEFRLRND